MERDRIAGILCGLSAAVIWGGFPVVTRFVVESRVLDGADIAFLRFLVAGALTAPWLLRRGLGGLGLLPAAVLTIGVGAPYILVITEGLARAPVGLFAAMTPGLMIALTALAAVVLLHEPLGLQRAVAIVAIMLGAALAALSGGSAAAGIDLAAAGLFGLGGAMWAGYTTGTRIWRVDALRATVIVSVGSAVVYCPIYLAWRGLAVFANPFGTVATQAIYQGVLVSVVALFLFSQAVKLLGAAPGASFAALVPGLAALEAWAFLGERPAPGTLAGLVLVSAGMVAMQMRFRRSSGTPA